MMGGGSLYANFMGELEVLCEDGSSMLTSKVIFVANLGVNLLSRRRFEEFI